MEKYLITAMQVRKWERQYPIMKNLEMMKELKWQSEEAHFRRKAAHARGRMLLGAQVQMKQVDLKWGTESNSIWLNTKMLIPESY